MAVLLIFAIQARLDGELLLLYNYLEFKIIACEELIMSDALKLYIALSRAYQTILRHDERDVARHGLNLTEFAVLELLYHKGPHPLQQIGSKILITTGTITYVINKLEKKGLLYREPCELDKRKIYAVLSEQGQRLVQTIFPDHARNLEFALAGLDAAEQQTAAALLKKLGHEAARRLSITTAQKGEL